MNRLRRNKRLLYVCNQVEKNGRTIYEKPIPIKVNYQPVADKDMGEVLAFGQDYINRMIVYINPNQRKYFKNFNRCYVFVEPPKEHDVTCSTADFYVDCIPTRYINESTVHLQRMKGDLNG